MSPDTTFTAPISFDEAWEILPDAITEQGWAGDIHQKGEWSCHRVVPPLISDSEIVVRGQPIDIL